jgi:hypothetical protein
VSEPRPRSTVLAVILVASLALIGILKYHSPAPSMSPLAPPSVSPIASPTPP